jgi:phosphonate transport system substrate-binding protein
VSNITFLAHRTCLILWSCLLIATHASAAETAPLKFGIMPFNSTLALIRTHQPLAAHLEQALGRKVQLLTSADYFTHVNQLLTGDFDLAITGPHFAIMAAEKGYRPLFRYAADLRPSFVVLTDSPIKAIGDLRGKRLGMPHRLAVISSSSIKWLDEQNLRLGLDYQNIEYASHGAAIAAVVAGEVDVTLSATSAWQQTPEATRAKTRLLATDIRLPHLMTLANGRLPKGEIERVRQALLSFGQTTAGQTFFRETSYQGYAEVTPADLEKLRPFINLTVKMMR